MLALSLVGLAACGAEELDAIVAVVNDDVVVESELRHETDLVIPQLQQQGTAVPPPDQLRKQVLERLILKRLQQQRAKQLGIAVDERPSRRH
jgi:peptidyl-prolyl cis-trans isomerase SurA